MSSVYRFDEFEVDPASFVITRSGRPVVLEPRAFDLLCYFLEHPNRTLTKTELLDAVWTDVSVTDNVLARAVVLIRKALGDEVRLARYIHTVPTRGYKFMARSPSNASSPAIEREDPHDGESADVTLAVLPFINATRDRADEHFSDGVSEDILNALAQDCTLRLAARASSFAFRDRTVDLPTVAARLRVEFVLDGTVRRIGDRVRISAELVEAATGYQMWSQRFDRALTDIFAVQDEIATAVATTTRAILRDRFGDRRALSAPPARTRPPAKPDAYDAFLKGRYLSRQRFVVMSEARRSFERSISLDPTFAPVYAALSENYGLCGLYAALPAIDAFLPMRRFAEQARALDPELAEPYYLLAAVALYFEWNVAACERHLREALARDPHHAGALTLSAILCAVCGRPDAAWAAADLAIRVDPIGMETRTWVMATAWLTRRFERQIAEADRLLADHPSYSDALRWRAMAYTVCGDYARARADLERFGAMTNRQLYYLIGLGTVAGLQGRVGEAEQILEEMRDRATREWVPPMAFGQVEQQLGHYDTALGWYERACQTRDFLLISLHVDPQFDIVPPGRTGPITEHPRWAALLQRVGVAPDCSNMDAACREAHAQAGPIDSRCSRDRPIR